MGSWRTKSDIICRVLNIWDRAIIKKKNNNNDNNNNNNNNKKITCKIVDFAVPADHRIKLKESVKKDKYLDLARELKKLWNMKIIVPIVIGALGTVTKGLLKGLITKWKRRNRKDRKIQKLLELCTNLCGWLWVCVCVWGVMWVIVAYYCVKIHTRSNILEVVFRIGECSSRKLCYSRAKKKFFIYFHT